MTRFTVRLACLAAVFAGAGLLTAGQAALAQEGKMKFEVYKDKAGEFRWRLKAANGKVLATPGQGYVAKADAMKGVENVQKAGKDDKMKFEIMEDAKKEHRWNLKAANGKIIAASSEGYKSKADAEKAVDLIKSEAAKAEVVEVKP